MLWPPRGRLFSWASEHPAPTSVSGPRVDFAQVSGQDTNEAAGPLKGAATGQWVRRHRRAIGLTQEELGERLGKASGRRYTQAAMSKIESGQNGLSYRTLRHLCKIFNTTVAEASKEIELQDDDIEDEADVPLKEP